MENESGDQRLRRLNQTRGGLRARASRSINKLNELLNNNLNEENKNELAALSDVLTKLRASLESANTEIQGIISEEETVTDMEKCDEYDDKLALHIQVKSKVAEANRDLITPETITNRISMNVGSSENGRLQLPKLDLPKFGGSYSQWASFSDLFNGAVHSSSTLTDSQKPFYLEGGLLRGEASRLLTSITVTDVNYEVARELLKKRYDNRRAIVREHISKIINAPPVTKQDPEALRNLWQ